MTCNERSSYLKPASLVKSALHSLTVWHFKKSDSTPLAMELVSGT
jgi:hypothetical protein